MVLTLPSTVSTPRLSLPVITAADAARMLAGERHASWHPDYPRRDDLDAVSLPAADGWGARHVVRAFDGQVVGTIGFFGPPEAHADGVVEAEVGCGLVREAWGHGAATEALQGLLAETDPLGVRVRAAVAPTNTAAVHVLAKCGFTTLRGGDDEGRLVMARPLPA